jgi:hypothetical protein
MERRQKIDNRGSKLLMVFTEPEAQDYWLEPGEEVEVRATIIDDHEMFELSLSEEGIVVWPSNGMGYISVWHVEQELCCGHKRPDGWGNYQ